MLPVCRGIQSGSSWQILVSLCHQNPAGTPGEDYICQVHIDKAEGQVESGEGDVRHCDSCQNPGWES